jgi:hypothetical protein
LSNSPCIEFLLVSMADLSAIRTIVTVEKSVVEPVLFIVDGVDFVKFILFSQTEAAV